MNNWRFTTKIYPTSINVSVKGEVGSCQLTRYQDTPDIWCVREFEVHVKRCGHGREMYTHICEYLRTKKAATRIQITSEDTPEALAFWSRMTGRRFSANTTTHTVDLSPASPVCVRKTSLK